MRPSYKNPYFYINNVANDIVYPIAETPTLISPESTYIDQYLISFGTPESTALVITKNGVEKTFDYAANIAFATQFNSPETLKTALGTAGINSTIIGTNLLIASAYSQGISAVTENSGYLTINSSTAVNNNTLVEKSAGTRYGNRSKVRMEIRYGVDNSLFTLNKVYIDYLKAPQFIRLTQEQVDTVKDTSQILEFPDYVCQEIVNDLTKLIMENAKDERLQTNIPINQTIANPQQEQPQQKR